MAEQIVGNDSFGDALLGWAKSGFETATGYVKDAAGVIYEDWRDEKIGPKDNSSANPAAMAYLNGPVQGNGQPYINGGSVGGYVAQYWPMMIAALIVLIVLAVLVARAF